jgi:hypothetical protein
LVGLVCFIFVCLDNKTSFSPSLKVPPFPSWLFDGCLMVVPYLFGVFFQDSAFYGLTGLGWCAIFRQVENEFVRSPKPKGQRKMSTHCIINITAQGKGRTSLFFHWDGYPEGASAYLWNAIQGMVKDATRGGLTEAIIRHNDSAEIMAHMSDPFAEIGAEFVYDIDAKCDPCDSAVIVRDRLRVIYSGDLAGLLNKYQELTADKGFTELKRVKVSSYGYVRWMNETLVKQVIEGRSGCLYHLRVWSQTKTLDADFKPSGNWRSCVADLNTIVEQFPNLMTAEMQGLLATRKAS